MSAETAGLFGGLAQGIFGRMREHEDDQRKIDLDEKKSALTSLSSLLEHATPETRPTIYKQMSAIMGLKGKHRGVWDMLTGGGRDDYHQQLSSKLDGVFGNIMGPKAYEAATTVAPASGNQADWGDESAGLTYTPPAGKIALRDPVAEHLTALKGQYGLQNDRRSQEIELRDRLQAKRELDNDVREAETKKSMQQTKAAFDAFKPIMQRAQALSGSLNPDEDSLEKAAQEHAIKNGLDIEKLREVIPGLKAKAFRDEQQGKLFQSQIGLAQPGDPGFGIRPGQQISLDREQDRAADKEFGDYQVHVNAAKLHDEEFRSALERLQGQLQAKGLYYKDGKIYQAGTNVEQPNQLRRYEDLIKELDTKKAKAQEQLGLAEGKRATLGKTYGSLYDIGKDVWGVSRKADIGGVASAGAPRTYDSTGKPGVSIADMQEVIGSQARPAANYKVGQILPIGGAKYKVTSITPPTEDRPFGSYVIQAIR